MANKKIAGGAQHRVPLPRRQSRPAATSVAAPEAGAARRRHNLAWAWMIVSALAGGLLLNLMPCVLPVIGLKILVLRRTIPSQPSLGVLVELVVSPASV